MDHLSRTLILMYHAVDDPRDVSEKRYCVPPESFRAQISWLAAGGYNPVPLSDIVDSIQKGTPLPRCSFAVTFDDGFECFDRNALPVLSEFRIPATLFAVAGKLGRTNDWMRAKGWPERRLLSASELRGYNGSGVNIGCHGLTHVPLTTVTNNQLRAETESARHTLEDALGEAVTLFAYPHGAHGLRERDAVAAAGFAAACSTMAGFNKPSTDLFALRRIDVFGTDSLAAFRRKLTFGANRVSTRDVARYYMKRLLKRLHA